MRYSITSHCTSIPPVDRALMLLTLKTFFLEWSALPQRSFRHVNVYFGIGDLLLIIFINDSYKINAKVRFLMMDIKINYSYMYICSEVKIYTRVGRNQHAYGYKSIIVTLF